MGGSSLAYDNGQAAMMNNPATVGLMDEGDRLDVFFGFLGPDVESKTMGMKAESDGTAYFPSPWSKPPALAGDFDFHLLTHARLAGCGWTALVVCTLLR